VLIGGCLVSLVLVSVWLACPAAGLVALGGSCARLSTYWLTSCTRVPAQQCWYQTGSIQSSVAVQSMVLWRQ